MSQHILNIPIEALAVASCDPEALVRLSLANRQLHSTISLQYVASRCVQEVLRQGSEIVRHCTSFESIALALAIDKLCKRPSRNYFFFAYGGGGTSILQETRHLLVEAASLALKHKHVHLHIDSHVGNRCPSGIAASTSLHRSHSIVRAFLDKGIEENRLSFKAWGKKVSMAWSEPEDEAAARSELYFVVQGMHFPPRPKYYELVPEADRPAIAHPSERLTVNTNSERVGRSQDNAVFADHPIQRRMSRQNYVVGVIDSLLETARQAKSMAHRCCRCQRRLAPYK
uniref:OmpA-like domain-containing protein n=1 Tax=Karlodinium veneficum TaxID=407301 RepID=A7WQ22_KARVE|nr:unknown [Karlodinium veneficum]